MYLTFSFSSEYPEGGAGDIKETWATLQASIACDPLIPGYRYQVIEICNPQAPNWTGRYEILYQTYTEQYADGSSETFVEVDKRATK